MAKDAERKRKLEQENTDKITPKRTRTSETISTPTAKAHIHGERNRSSPSVIVSRKEGASIQAANNKPLSTTVVTQKPVETKKIAVEIKPNASKDPTALVGTKKIDRRKNKLRRENEIPENHGDDMSFDVVQIPSTRFQNDWTFSSPTAARFLDHDPLFVVGDNGSSFIVAASRQQVKLLSLASSLVAQTYEAPEGRSVACFARSPSMATTIDIALDNGVRIQWNWSTAATQSGVFPGAETVKAMTTSANPTGRSDSWYISQSDLKSSIIYGREEVYTTSVALKSLCVVGEGDYIVAISGSALVIGARRNTAQGDSKFTWIEIPAQDTLTAVDARLVSQPTKAKPKQKSPPDCAIAVGNSRGQIHLLTSVASVFTSPTTASLNQARILHWHRDSLPTVKFSKDGNYLISGGTETVLVLWQLDTGNRQYLPHLTSEIERIVVSPDGTRYALQMGDNSIMVLSTSELKPVAHFAGLQHSVQLPPPSNQSDITLPAPAATLHPSQPGLILISVPATQPKTSRSVTSRPFLQTFDVPNSRHVTRQALTRNNVTDLNSGPENTPIIPPDVSQLALSADGQWLATVDDWFPPAWDLQHTVSKVHNLDNTEIEELEEQQGQRREVYLKFWHWNQEQGLWALTSRVDAPHARSIGADVGDGAGQVLKLVSDPSTNGFATIGPDGCIKIWRPRARTHRGLPAQPGNDSIAMTEWACKHSTVLPMSSSFVTGDQALVTTGGLKNSEEFEIGEASLAFAPDGSLLACAYGGKTDESVEDVHFVSPLTGNLIVSKAGLATPTGALFDMGFIDRYFVVLTDEGFRVWNLIDDTHQYTVALPPSPTPWHESILAINRDDDTFAIATSREVDRENFHRLEVFTPRQPDSLFKTSLHARPAAVLTSKGSSGFTIIFEDNTIRTLIPPNGQHVPRVAVEDVEVADVIPEASNPAELVDALTTVMEPDDVEMENSQGFSIEASAEAFPEDDRPVVRPEQLAAIFDVGQSYALPSIQDMFQSVVGLYARKPYHDAEQGNAMEIDASA